MIARLMGLPVLSPRELQRRLDGAERVVVVDVNARPSWLHARVPGARHLDPQTFSAVDLPADIDRPLVFYCSGPLCRKAPQAARRALQMGRRNVSVLSAGITGWQAAGMPVDSGEAAP